MATENMLARYLSRSLANETDIRISEDSGRE